MSRALNVRVPDGLYEKIEAKAAMEDRSVSKVVVRALEQALGGRLSEGEPGGRVEPQVGSSPSGDQRGHRATDASEGASPSLSRSSQGLELPDLTTEPLRKIGNVLVDASEFPEIFGTSENSVIDDLEKLPGVVRASSLVEPWDTEIDSEPFEEGP